MQNDQQNQLLIFLQIKKSEKTKQKETKQIKTTKSKQAREGSNAIPQIKT